MFGSNVVKLTAAQLFTLNLEAKPIKLPYRAESSKGEQPYTQLFEGFDYTLKDVLTAVRMVASGIHDRLSQPDTGRGLEERLHDDPFKRVFGCTGHTFLPYKDPVPQSPGGLEDSNLKLSFGAAYEGFRAQALRPLLFQETHHLPQIRKNIAAILGPYALDGIYRYADTQDGDEDAPFIDLLADPEEVAQLKAAAENRVADKEFYAAVDPLVDFAEKYQGFYYFDEEEGHRRWDPRCRLLLDLLLEVSDSLIISLGLLCLDLHPAVYRTE